MATIFDEMVDESAPATPAAPAAPKPPTIFHEMTQQKAAPTIFDEMVQSKPTIFHEMLASPKPPTIFHEMVDQAAAPPIATIKDFSAVPQPAAQLPPNLAPLQLPGLSQPPTAAPIAPQPMRGLLQPGNIDLRAQPEVANPDGSISTVDSFSINQDGREILLPTVMPDGRHLPQEQAIAEFQKTGRHLGMFDTPENATAYATQLHNDYAAGKYRPVAPAIQPLRPPVTPQTATSSEAQVARFAAAQGLPHTSTVTGRPYDPRLSLVEEAVKENALNRRVEQNVVADQRRTQLANLLAEMPEVPGGRDREQDRDVVAQRDWLRQHPDLSDLIDQEPDPSVRNRFRQTYYQKITPGVLSFTTREEAERAMGRINAQRQARFGGMVQQAGESADTFQAGIESGALPGLLGITPMQPQQIGELSRLEEERQKQINPVRELGKEMQRAGAKEFAKYAPQPGEVGTVQRIGEGLATDLPVMAAIGTVYGPTGAATYAFGSTLGEIPQRTNELMSQGKSRDDAAFQAAREKTYEALVNAGATYINLRGVKDVSGARAAAKQAALELMGAGALGAGQSAANIQIEGRKFDSDGLKEIMQSAATQSLLHMGFSLPEWLGHAGAPRPQQPKPNFENRNNVIPGRYEPQPEQTVHNRQVAPVQRADEPQVAPRPSPTGEVRPVEPVAKPKPEKPLTIWGRYPPPGSHIVENDLTTVNGEKYMHAVDADGNSYLFPALKAADTGTPPNLSPEDLNVLNPEHQPPTPKTPPPVEGSLPTQRPQGPRFTGRNAAGENVEGTLVAKGQGEAAIKDATGKLHVVALDQLRQRGSPFVRAETPKAESPGQVPHPVYTQDELRRMPKAQLKQNAEDWGVTFDARSTTIPRILDSVARWHLDQLSDSELYWQTRNAGLRAGTREANIDTLIGAGVRRPLVMPSQTKEGVPSVAVGKPAVSPGSSPENLGAQPSLIGSKGAPAPNLPDIDNIRTVETREPLRQSMHDASSRGWDYQTWARNFPQTSAKLGDGGEAAFNSIARPQPPTSPPPPQRRNGQLGQTVTWVDPADKTATLSGRVTRASKDGKSIVVELPDGQKRLISTAQVTQTTPPAEESPPPSQRAEPTPPPREVPATIRPQSNRSARVETMPIESLHVDPQRFQYKLNTDSGGTTGLLKGVQTFDAARAGVVAVWTDPADGKTYVVNGHHRYELARRTGQQTLNVLHLEAESAAQARTIGALINISEGRGTAVDAAKLIRDTGLTVQQLRDNGASLTEGKLADGVALSRLSPYLFEKVVHGKIAEGKAVAIGRSVPDHAGQNALYALLFKREATGKPLHIDEIEELARLVQQSPTTEETQGSLFGTETIKKNLALEKARLSAWVKRQISTDKKLFGMVARSKNAEILARGGNVIDTEQSGSIAQGAAEAEYVYNALSTKVGPISEALNDAARRLAAGEDFNGVTKSLYPKVRAELSAPHSEPAPGRGEGVRAGEVSAGGGAAERPSAPQPRPAAAQPELKPSGLTPESTRFNTAPHQLEGYAWRTMGAGEFEKLIGDQMRYAGGEAKRANYFAPTPESASQYGGKGKYLVEFGGVERAEGETVSNPLGKENVTAIWQHNGEKWEPFQQPAEVQSAAKVDTGVFGQREYLPTTGEQQSFFPSEKEPSIRTGETPEDAKIRRQYQAGEKATPSMFGEARPEGKLDAQAELEARLYRDNPRYRDLSDKFEKLRAKIAAAEDPSRLQKAADHIYERMVQIEEKARQSVHGPQSEPVKPIDRANDQPKNQTASEAVFQKPIAGGAHGENVPSDWTVDELSTMDLRRAAKAWGQDFRAGTRKELIDGLKKLEEARGEPFNQETIFPKRKGGGGSIADRIEPAGKGEEEGEGAKFEAKPGTAPGSAGRSALYPIQMPELVKLAKDLMGELPEINSRLRSSRGIFRPEGPGAIDINPEIAKDPYQIAKTLAHEIGHLTDYLSDRTMARGNLLGRVKSFKPVIDALGHMRGWLKDTFGDGGPKNSELRKELMELSAWWRPGDMTTPYRKSSKELYADALSVLLNSPGELEARAPKFYAELLKQLDKKPEVLQSYLNLQDILAGTPAELAARRRKDIREAFGTAESVVKARGEERQAADASIIAQVRQYLYDSARPITDMTKQIVKERGRTPEALAAQHALDELGYSNSVNHLMLRDMERHVVQPARAAGLSLDDLGEYLFLDRIAHGDRAEVANPYGHTPQTAADQLHDLQNKLGPEKWSALQKSIEKFHDITWKSVERAVEVGTYGKDQFEEKILPNKGHYAAFGVVDHLLDYVPAGIRSQIGTFKEVGNPFTLTVMKTLSLNRLNELQSAKNQVRDWMKQNFKGDIKGPYKMDQYHRPPTPQPGNEHLVILEDGKPVSYEVDKYVAKMFERHDIGWMSKIGRLASSFTYLRHPLYIVGSPGFQVGNIIRDLRRTWVNLGALQGTSIKQIIKAYWDAKGPAWRRARGIDDPLIEQMMKEKALDAPFSRYNHEQGEVDDRAYRKMLQQYGLEEPKHASKVFAATIGRLMKGAETVGTFIETVPKVAGFRLTERTKLDPRERSYIVRNFVGTPNLRRRGLATDLVNGVLMYENAWAQGVRSDAELAVRPTTRAGWALRRLAIDVAPKLLQKAAVAGAFGAGVRMMMQSIGDYDLANYTCIPLGVSGDGDDKKTVYLRIPHDETGRAIGSVLWAILDYPASGITKGISNALNYGYGGLPGWAPWINEVSTGIDYMKGQNPTDYRGQPIMTDDEFKAGGWPADKAMLRWELGQWGVISEIAQSVMPPRSGTQRTTTEAIFSTIPGLNRLIKFSDKGIAQDQWEDIAVKESEEARFRLGLPDEVKPLLKEHYRLDRMLDTEKLSGRDMERLGEVDDFYSNYIDTTDKMKKAQMAGDKATVEKLRNELAAAAKASQTALGKPTPEQREKQRAKATDRVLNSDLPYDKQDRILNVAGLEPPPDVPINRAFHGLNQKATKLHEADEKADSIIRRVEAARGDVGKIEALMKEGEALVNSTTPLSEDEQDRLKILTAARDQIRRTRLLVKEGSVPKAQGEAFIRDLVQKLLERKLAA